MNFNKLNWLSDRLLINDWVFRLEYNRNDDTWERGEQCLPLLKSDSLLDSYANFFGKWLEFQVKQIVEIGMFYGGSIALWNEIFKPDTIVGIDIQPCKENDYFRNYLSENNLVDKIHRYWSTNQSDKKRMVEICSYHMDQGIDLVLDDASHLYEPTKKSFEALFPLLRPGGLYIIEDWNWAHTEPFQKDTSVWRNELPLTKLIFDIVEAVGSSPLISNVHLSNGYVVIEKSCQQYEQQPEFCLEKLISRRPHETFL